MAFTAKDGRTQSALAEINMVPFIDVVLVLLIIFMVTAPVIQSGVEVNVPQTQLVRELLEEKLLIQIDKDENVYLMNDPVNINELAALVRERVDPTRQTVYLRSDKDISVGAFMMVLDVLKVGGIESVSIVTEPLETPRR